jgi:hypothetical protein
VITTTEIVHLDAECGDYLNGDQVASPLATYGEVTCGTCRTEAQRTL